MSEPTKTVESPAIAYKELADWAIEVIRESRKRKKEAKAEMRESA